MKLIILLLGLVITGQAEPLNPVTDLNFPEGVSFGMSAAELKVARPSVMLGGKGSIGGAEAAEMNEEKSGIRTVYLYRFKGEELGAIQYMRIRSVATNMFADVETTRLLEKLSTSDATLTARKTAQAGQVLNIKQWTMENPNLEVCFIATSEGTAITFFSASYFSFKDLFPDASETTKQRTNISKSSAENGSMAENPNGIDRFSTNAPPNVGLSTD